MSVTPRSVTGMGDLRVGQTVAWLTYDNKWKVCDVEVPTDWNHSNVERGIVILADPPRPDFLVPAETLAALQKRVEAWESDKHGGAGYSTKSIQAVAAARAVLDVAVEVAL